MLTILKANAMIMTIKLLCNALNTLIDNFIEIGNINFIYYLLTI